MNSFSPEAIQAWRNTRQSIEEILSNAATALGYDPNAKHQPAVPTALNRAPRDRAPKAIVNAPEPVSDWRGGITHGPRVPTNSVVKVQRYLTPAIGNGMRVADPSPKEKAFFLSDKSSAPAAPLEPRPMSQRKRDNIARRAKQAQLWTAPRYHVPKLDR